MISGYRAAYQRALPQSMMARGPGSLSATARAVCKGREIAAINPRQPARRSALGLVETGLAAQRRELPPRITICVRRRVLPKLLPESNGGARVQTAAAEIQGPIPVDVTLTPAQQQKLAQGRAVRISYRRPFIRRADHAFSRRTRLSPRHRAV
jgi:hypothetical protein